MLVKTKASVIRMTMKIAEERKERKERKEMKEQNQPELSPSGSIWKKRSQKLIER